MAKQKKEIHAVVLFDGTGNDRADNPPSNILETYRGLVQDKNQIVIYKDGIGNDYNWPSWLQWISRITGVGGQWIMLKAYDELLKEIKQSIDQTLKESDDPNNTEIKITLDLSGFSRGAALARAFINSYLGDKLTKDLAKSYPKTLIEIDKGSVSLYDTVGAFGIPFNIPFIENFIKNQEIDPGYDLTVKEGWHVRHAVSLDEMREPFTPTLVDSHENVHEVWYSGDHSEVGGNKGSIPLTDMLRFAEENGLRFNESFRTKHQLDSDTPRGLNRLRTPDNSDYPNSQIEVRDVYVRENGRRSKDLPTISESTLERMRIYDKYRPPNVMALDKFNVERHDRRIVTMTAEGLRDYIKSPTQVDLLKQNTKPLTFSPALEATGQNTKPFDINIESVDQTPAEKRKKASPLKTLPGIG